MFSESVISVQNLSKCYKLYKAPADRLKQSFYSRLRDLIGLKPIKYFDEFWALHQLSFSVKKGETVGIIGANGSGKSTLLQIICGTLTPTSGSVDTKGRLGAILELGTGFNPEFTGRENVYLSGSVLGMKKKEVDEKFNQIASFAEIGSYIDKPVKTYSAGMFVRLAFSIQSNIDPDIFIIDEALAVGDSYFVHRCMLRFDELKKSGVTILFVSHDVNSVRNLCDRVIWIDQGQIREQGDSSKVTDLYLANLFERKIVKSTDPSKEIPQIEKDKQGHDFENTIPNCDRRLGDQKYCIMGVGLYDEQLTPISSSYNNTSIILRVTFKNNTLNSNNALIIGYIFRNSKGQELASTNSNIEGKSINLSNGYDLLTVKIKITLPYLYPGSYTFTVTVAYETESGEIMLADRIENAVCLDLLSKKKMHVMMSFPTTFELV